MLGMRVLVIGLGEVGINIARTLSAQRQEVIVVDSDRGRIEAIQSELDVLSHEGNGASPRFLAEIGAGEVDLLCAVTQSDEVNVIAALAGHQLGAKRTIARVRDEDYFGSDDNFARENFGIDMVIQPERAAAESLAEAVRVPGAVQVEHFAGGRLSVAEIVLSPGSPLNGVPLRDRRKHPASAVIGFIRDGRTIAAEPGHRLNPGDHLLVAAAREHIGEVASHFAGSTSKVRDVTIFGAGRIGVSLAQNLLEDDAYRVTLMERDPDRARHVAEILPGATVLMEEGVAEEALIASGVDRAGAFIASAGDDRANLLATLHAKRIGASLSLAVVSREEFVPLVDALEIDAAVSPRLVTAEAILRSLRGGQVQAMRLLLGGSEIIEAEAETGCRACGLSAEQVGSIGQTHVAALARGEEVLVGEQMDRIQAGDRVLVFSPRQGLSDVQRTFEARG